MQNNEFDIFRIFYILKKRFTAFILILILVSTALFIKFHFFAKPLYISQYSVYSTVIESKVIAEEINSLQKLIEIKDYKSIADKLNIDIQSAKSIKLFNAKDIADLQKRMATVTINGKDSTLLYQIPELIEIMISNIPIYKQTADNYREFLDFEKAKIESELETAISVAPGTNINISIRGTGELLDRKLKNSENIKNFKLFGLVGKNNISKPQATMKYNITAAILGGIAAALFLVLFLEFILFIKKRMNEYEN